MTLSLPRPQWDDWFMSLALLVSSKSIDPDTKHGCIIVGRDNTILSVGYNSPPRGCIDTHLPLTRPEKYKIMEHSESNAIVNAARCGTPLYGSTFYITGHPCPDCLRKIINVGAVKVLYGPIGSACITEDDKAIMSLMLKGQALVLNKYNSHENIIELMTSSINYLSRKVGDQSGKEKASH